MYSGIWVADINSESENNISVIYRSHGHVGNRDLLAVTIFSPKHTYRPDKLIWGELVKIRWLDEGKRRIALDT